MEGLAYSEWLDCGKGHKSGVSVVRTWQIWKVNRLKVTCEEISQLIYLTCLILATANFLVTTYICSRRWQTLFSHWLDLYVLWLNKIINNEQQLTILVNLEADRKNSQLNSFFFSHHCWSHCSCWWSADCGSNSWIHLLQKV